MFGSSGHVVQPPSVRLNFTRASLKPPHPDILTKYIVRSHALTWMWIHHPFIGKSLYKRWQQPDPEHVLLNHYNILARERYKRVKLTRGDPNEPLFDQVRNMEYFDTYDKGGNETDNLELRDLVLSAVSSRLRPSTSYPLTQRKPQQLQSSGIQLAANETMGSSKVLNDVFKGARQARERALPKRGLRPKGVGRRSQLHDIVS